MRRTEEALVRVRQQYQNLFQTSAASFMELDFSRARPTLQALTEQGARDLEQYLKSNPSLVREMIGLTEVVRVNEQGVSLIAGGDQASFPRNFDALWPDDSLGVLAEMFASIAMGKIMLLERSLPADDRRAAARRAAHGYKSVYRARCGIAPGQRGGHHASQDREGRAREKRSPLSRVLSFPSGSAASSRHARVMAISRGSAPQGRKRTFRAI